MKHSYEINKVLVPIDFSDISHEIIEHAIRVAKRVDASIHLLHVMNVGVQVFPNLSNFVDMSKLKDNVREELTKVAGEVGSKSGISIETEIIESGVAKGITEVAKKIKADLIMMGTHGASGFEEFFLGSNASRVVTASTCPVLTLRSGIEVHTIEKIVLPIDSSKSTRDKVSEVTYIAKLLGSEVSIVGLVTKDHEEEINVFNLKIKQIEEHFDHHGVNYKSKVIHGSDITEMTLSYAQAIDADLIAIMTEQEASTGLLVGPHAQRIVNHSRIPVFSVTPMETLDLSDDGSNLRPFS